jgi:hypothetical protein
MNENMALKLEQRLKTMERCVFGDQYDSSTLTQPTNISPQLPTLSSRIAILQNTIPKSLTGFEQVYQYYKELGLTNEHDLKKLLATPLNVTHKIDIILANSNHLQQLSLTAETIHSLKDFIGGDAWFHARDELQRLANTEVVAGDLLTTSSDLAKRVDASLECWDSVVRLVSKKMSVIAES